MDVVMAILMGLSISILVAMCIPMWKEMFRSKKSKYEPKTDIWVAVRREVERNFEHWGEQNWAIDTWVSVLMEEVGEVAKEVNGEHRARLQGHEVRRVAHLKNCRNELIQVAAVTIQAVESLDRNELKEYRR